MSQLNDTTKQALRLAAVGALLHNLGKIHAKFLDKQINRDKASEDAKKYLYLHILALISPHLGNLPTDWYDNERDADQRVNLNEKYAQGKLDASRLQQATITSLTTPKSNFSLPFPLDDRNYTVGDLIEYAGIGEEWYKKHLDDQKYGIEHIFPGGSRLTHLMNRAHRGASGGEKEDIAAAQQPDAADLYLSTPFGYETTAPNINTINDLLQKIEPIIQNYLASPTDPLPLAELIAELRPLLSRAIADTRRPLNDVTVGDIGHTGMAFLLTQAAEWILTGRAIDHDELAKKETENTLLWRVLTIHTDSLRYLKEATSLADLRVRQQQLQEAFQEISQKLEETLLAVEIYADEQRRLFLFPNLDQSTDTYQAVEDIVTKFNVDGLRLTGHLSGPVTNHPDDKNGTYIGEQVLEQLQTAPPYDFDAGTIAAFWPKEGPNKQLCTACNVRPQGYGAEQIEGYKRNPTYYRNKAEGRNICCVCMERRSGVAQKWAEEELNTTVWLDEVADDNGRLALIVGQWDLVTFIKSISYPKSKEDVNERQEPDFFRRLDKPIPWIRLTSLLNTPGTVPAEIQIGRSSQVTYTQNELGWFVGEQGRECPNKFKRPTFPQLNLSVDDIYPEGGEYFIRLSSPHQHSGSVQLVRQNFEVVDDHTLKTVDEAGRNKVADLFFYDNQFIVSDCIQVHPTTPNYSFARLRRIWETTRTFWNEVQTEILQDLSDDRRRLKIYLDGVPRLGRFHAYDLALGASELSVVWVPPENTREGYLVSIDNLCYLARQLGAKPGIYNDSAAAAIFVEDYLRAQFVKQSCQPILYNSDAPAGREKKNLIEGLFIREIGYQTNQYATAIPILAEPRSFIMLVPADKSLTILQRIKEKYEEEMGKVRDRLSLHLGCVYAHRRTPLYAVLDAGRAIFSQRTTFQQWLVKSLNQPQTGTGDLELELEHNGYCIRWQVLLKMRDGITKDRWYPYLFLETNGDDQKVDANNRRAFKASRPDGNGKTVDCWIVHAADLRPGETIYLMPSTFDFLWLDAASRRFEIHYEADGRRSARPSRPFYLEDLDRLETLWGCLKQLTRTQLKQCLQTIETARERWFGRDQQRKSTEDETFRQFVADTLANAQWDWKAIPKDQREKLIAAGARGELADLEELHLEILKEKNEKNEGETL